MIVNGTIISVVEKETSNGKKYKNLNVMPEVGTDVKQFNVFENQFELDRLIEGRQFSFDLVENGKYLNVNSISDVPEGKQITLNADQQKKITETHFERLDQELAKPKPKPKPKQIYNKTDDDFIILNGKKYTTQKGLLNNAHKKGLQSIITELIKYEDGIAVMKATVTMKDGTVFTGIGDADKNNVNSNIAKHILRMSETRSVNRALRLATNQAETSIDEITDNDSKKE